MTYDLLIEIKTEWITSHNGMIRQMIIKPETAKKATVSGTTSLMGQYAKQASLSNSAIIRFIQLKCTNILV